MEKPITHPLSMLLPSEISLTVSLLKSEKNLSSSFNFVSIMLKEPSKYLILSYKPGDSIIRETTTILLDKSECKVYEAVVNLYDKKVVSFMYKPEVHAKLMIDEFIEFEKIVKADPKFKELCIKKGITDPNSVVVGPWPSGYYGIEEEDGKRTVQGMAFARFHPKDNFYAHPLGILVIFDLNLMKVLSLVADDTQVPIVNFPYIADQITLRDPTIKPLEIIQSEGPSFVVEDNHLSWENWSIRFGFNSREGLLLHQISYYDKEQGKIRPILYRLSISEMVTMYSDPSPIHRRKNALDIGEYGIGSVANSLKLGCDCLGEIKYFDVWMNNSKGEPVLIPNAICLHEEDYGIGWKHYDWRLNHTETRRSRRLVLSSIYTAENYEYGVFFYFYLDATIQVEIKLTGVMTTQAIHEDFVYGQKLGPKLGASSHQHYINFRIDPCLDGLKNSVVETHTESEAFDKVNNPYGNAFKAVSKTFKKEQEAQRNIDPSIARTWTICNQNVHNCVGEPVSYKLIPGETCFPFHLSRSPFLQRAGFVEKNLWVTPYDEKERYATGEYPIQNKEGDGLPVWTKKNRNIENEDIVLWYTAGHHHYPRLEDWPVMPVDYVGFSLKPKGFFNRNPAIDVNPSLKGEKKKKFYGN